MECRERRVRRVNLEGKKPEEGEQQQRLPVFLLAGEGERSNSGNGGMMKWWKDERAERGSGSI